jgi:hypothetical protein
MLVIVLKNQIFQYVYEDVGWNNLAQDIVKWHVCVCVCVCVCVDMYACAVYACYCNLCMYVSMFVSTYYLSLQYL